MADRGNHANGTKSWFGSGLKHWKTSYDTQPDLWANSDLFTRPNTHRDHVCRPVIIGSDGRARPVILECPPKHHHKHTTAGIEENAYRVQPAGPRTKDHVTDEPKVGFSGGMFQHSSTDYDPKPMLITEGGWTRPSTNGWKLPPEAPLGKATNNIYAATEYLRGSEGPPSSIGWAGSDPNVRRGQVVRMPTIDSREAVKKYGGKFTW